MLVLNKLNNEIKFEHYDSLINGNKSIAKKVANSLCQILFNEFKLDIKYSLNLLNFEPLEVNCVKQTNTFDCGIHLLCNVEALTHLGEDFENKKKFFEFANLEIVKKKREQIKKIINQLKEE